MPRDYPVAGDPAMAQSDKVVTSTARRASLQDLRIRAQVGLGLAR